MMATSDRVVEVFFVLSLFLLNLPVADTQSSSSSIQPTPPIPVNKNNTAKVSKTTAVPPIQPTPSVIPATKTSRKVGPHFSSKAPGPRSSQIVPTKSSHVISTASPRSTSIAPTLPPSVTPAPVPHCHCKCEDCTHYKSNMWVATGFAIFLGAINVILICLMVRQQRIHRDIQDDPALSRLI